MLVDSAPSISTNLLRWYDRHARDLPWRSPPGTPSPDPYRVWLSEIMLQQTTVAAVKPYYERFLARWPSVRALAATDEAELMAAWAGLGYYSRARNLIACARVIVQDHDGVFPANEEALRSLPGIGAYTATAITAIAFGKRAVVIDGNVERVIARLVALKVPVPQAKAVIRDYAELITPEARPGDFAQAMMDLGATICTPRNPSCMVCPLSHVCEGKISPEAFPVRPEKKPRSHRTGLAWWLEHDGHVLLHRRPEKGMLGGMLALPSDDWCGGMAGEAKQLAAVEWKTVGSISHVFTHFSLDLEVRAGTAPARSNEPGQWWPIDRLKEAGLPTVFAKAAALAQKARDSLQERA